MSDEPSTKPTTRFHLPTPGEICHSTLVIEQLHIDIQETTAKIKHIESQKNTEMDEYHQRVRLIRGEIETMYMRARDVYWSVLKTINDMDHTEWKKERARRDAEISILKAQRREIEKKAEFERAFISSIRKLPNEIHSEIFLSCILGETATRYTLARVCRSWKHIVLQTPRLWSKISPHEWGSRPIEQLQARLRLSGCAPLDVTIRKFPWNISQQEKVNVHKEFAKHGIERWRSLTIMSYDFENPVSYLLGIYTGKFTSLHHFIIDGILSPEGFLSFSELFSLIADSQPLLQTLAMTGMHKSPGPHFTQESFLASSLNSLSCPYEFFQKMVIPSTLTSIFLRGATGKSNGIFKNVTKAEFYHYSWQCVSSFPNVTELILKGTTARGLPVETIHFPHLQVLDIDAESPSTLGIFSAPCLKQLVIRSLFDRQETSASPETLALFKGGLLMAPAVLDFGFEVLIPALRSICAAWPQMKQVRFRLSKKLQIQNLFVAMLTKAHPTARAPKLCPSLIRLELEIDSALKPKQAEIEQWAAYSKQLFACRDALAVIKCTWPKLYDPRGKEVAKTFRSELATLNPCSAS